MKKLSTSSSNPQENQVNKSMTKFADCNENSINFFMRYTQFFYCFCSLIFFLFCQPYTFEMVLLNRSRISFLPDPFWVLTLLVAEFVVSPTHNYATFSSYGLNVYCNYLFHLCIHFFFF